jgi:hypothetical protein
MTVNDAPPFGSPWIATDTRGGRAITVTPIAKQQCRCPDGEGIDRAEPRNAEADGVGWFPRDRDDVGEQRGSDTCSGGIASADGDRARHQRPSDRDYEPLPPCDAAEPRLQLGHNPKGRRERHVELDRVDPKVAETQRARAHAPNVDGPRRRVISRSADPGALKDQPAG